MSVLCFVFFHLSTPLPPKKKHTNISIRLKWLYNQRPKKQRNNHKLCQATCPKSCPAMRPPNLVSWGAMDVFRSHTGSGVFMWKQGAFWLSHLFADLIFPSRKQIISHHFISDPIKYLFLCPWFPQQKHQSYQQWRNRRGVQGRQLWMKEFPCMFFHQKIQFCPERSLDNQPHTADATALCMQRFRCPEKCDQQSSAQSREPVKRRIPSGNATKHQ